jgi:hypothetical protein
MQHHDEHEDDEDNQSIVEKHSVLDDLGAEVTGIAFPVSICMVITIALVRVLHPDTQHRTSDIIIAEAFYNEKVLLRPCIESAVFSERVALAAPAHSAARQLHRAPLTSSAHKHPCQPPRPS